MFFFTRWGFAGFRWLVTVGLLVLIVQLLIRDTVERRPFLQQAALRVVAGVESACGRAKAFIFADVESGPVPAPSGADAGSGESPAGPEGLPSQGQPHPSDLPVDFLDQLEQAVARSGARSDLTDWAAFRGSREHAVQLETATRLARNLPPQWWPVDGEMVHELDLPTVLRNRASR